MTLSWVDEVLVCREAGRYLVSPANINLCFRHSLVSTIYSGISKVLRSMIAEEQLALPRSR